MIESSALSRDRQDFVQEFIVRFTKQAGIIYQAESPDKVVSIVNGLIKSQSKGESCCANDLELATNGSRTNISPRIESTISYDNFHKNPRQVAGLIDVGVTRADGGIAETGSIIDVSYTDEHRLLSSLSRVHIAVLERSKIVGKLSMLSPMMKELLGRESQKKRPSITFIGGPSRTSDIELKSVLGVHGPHEVHVVLL